jgi:hypothetical protein
MIADSFIETVISPKRKTMNTETQTMISREFNGMEAVAQFESQAPTEAYRNNTDDERSED